MANRRQRADGSERPADSRTGLAPWRVRLLAVAAGLSTCGTLLAVGYLGWWLHDRNPGKPIAVEVNRPVRVVQETGTAPDRVPNVLGLDADTARQTMIDAGIDAAAVTLKQQPFAGAGGLVITQDPGPGAQRASKVVLAMSAPATMPTVVGLEQVKARKMLNDLGARVVTEFRYAAGAKEGTVTAAEPSPGVPLPGSVKLTLADAPSSVFLSELEAIRTDCNTDETQIAGRTFKNPLVCSPAADSPAQIEYALGRRAGEFVATVGLSDRSAATAPVRFRVLGDRRQLFSRVVPAGSDVRVTVPVSGVLRLRLETLVASGAELSDSVSAVWGNARVLGGRQAIDQLTTVDTP